MKQSKNRYLESQVLTASPEQLVVMLYDGALRFCAQAQEAIRERRIAEANDLLIRAQRIVLELLCALRPEAAPEVGKNLATLYTYVYEQLVWANLEGSGERVETAMKVLGTLREGWSGAADKVRREGDPA